MKNQILFSCLTFTSLTAVTLVGSASAFEHRNLRGDSFSHNSNSTLVSQNKKMGEGRKDRLMEQLNLSSEQKQQMDAIRAKYQSQFESLASEIRAERTALNEMMRNNQSENNLRSQHQKITSLNQRMADLRFNSMLEMRAVLNPEQRQQWGEMMGNRRASGGNRPR